MSDYLLTVILHVIAPMVGGLILGVLTSPRSERLTRRERKLALAVLPLAPISTSMPTVAELHAPDWLS